MNNTGETNPTRRTERDATYPRAIVHKRILEVAEEQPEASMDEIAAEIGAATPALVEQVLEEYGDPGDDTADADPTADAAETTPGDDEAPADSPTDEAATSSPEPAPDERHASADDTGESDHQAGPADSTAAESVPEPDAVTETQLETLRAIRERPTATQAALAEQLGVTGATISQRVNGIDGFDWATRRAFVDRFFAQDGIEPLEAPPAEDLDGDDMAADTAATSDAADGVDNAGGTATDTAPGDVAARSDGGTTASGSGDHDGAPTDEPTAEQQSARDARGAGPSPGDARDHDRAGADPAAEGGHERTAPTDGAPGDAREHSVAALAEQVAELTARLETLEGQLGGGRTHTVDPALARKVLRVCFQADEISTAEEIELVDGILAAESTAMAPPPEAPTEPSSAD